MMYYSGINAFVWCLAIATVAIAVYYATQVVISWLSWRGKCKENASQAFFLRHYTDKVIKEFSDSIIALEDKVAKLEKRLGDESESKECNADKEVLNEKEG